jgi:cytochrome b
MIKIWDGYIRFFHWALTLMLITLYYSAENDLMAVHLLAGLTVLALMISRLIWGLIGSETAKISALFHHPKAAFKALTTPSDTPGHNPAGSYMILVFFGLLILQLLSGLMSSDDVFTDGPLVKYIPSEWVEWATDWHHLVFDGLLVAIVLHLVAIVLYRLKGKRLIKAMFSGSRAFEHDNKPEPPTLRPGWQGFIIFALCWLSLLSLWGMDAINELVAY